MMLISTCGLLMACGPGRFGGSRKPNSTPMGLKQSLPDVEETSIDASGSYRGPMKRGSEEFKALVRNFNTDIVFKDDEKNEDDRRMTKNCEKKLNILAAAVKAQWGVKLRVIDAYDLDDEKKHHSKHSLHHEGRAVDITTDDRDKAKYAMLGRMAYNAGFDWVFYATRGFVHASVKSADDAAEQETMGCFPETAKVHLEGGWTKPMKDLQIGDKVASMDSSGRLVYSKVLTFLDIKPSRFNTFISIETKNPAAKVAITETHLIYQLNKHALQETAVYARDLKAGDLVYVQNGSAFEKFTAGRVVRVKKSQGKGAYAPLTETGSIVVDNVLCSCYAVISDPHVAHWSFAPLRFAEWLFPGFAAHNKTGMHWYAKLLYKIYTSWNFVHENVLENS